MIGRMNQMAKTGLWEGPFHYRALQRYYTTWLHKIGYHMRSQLIQITLSPQSMTELRWWTSPKLTEHNKMSLHPPPIDMTITTDASTKGWGAVSLEIRAGGRWSSSEAMLHINYLELKAALLAIQSFDKGQAQMPRHLRLLMDNSTAVAYINKNGGTRSSLLTAL